MLKVLYPPALKTSSLRSIRYGDWPHDDQIITKVGQHRRSTRTRKIIGHPKVGWTDDWDKAGNHYSARVKGVIAGKVGRRHMTLYPHQERKFKYAPAISWEDNPASWEMFIWSGSPD